MGSIGGFGYAGGRNGVPVMSLPEIAGLLRRHLIAVLVVLAIAACVDYEFKHTTASYAETSTMVFVPPVSGVHPNPLEAVGGALTESAGVLAAQAMSPAEQQEVQRMGGAASYDVELVNSYNLQYPNFSSPYLTITTTAADPATAHRTYTILTRLLTNQFTAQQAETGAQSNNRAQIIVSGDTGPLIQQGSPKRALFGLILLTLVAVFSVATFFDRHPVRLSRLWAGSGGRSVPLGSRPASSADS
jgi:hypothetical protein